MRLFAFVLFASSLFAGLEGIQVTRPGSDVPEPATIGFIGVALVGGVFMRRTLTRRRK